MNEVPKPICDQRYHKPNPGRICCEECCCHLTTSYLVGVRDHGGRHAASISRDYENVKAVAEAWSSVIRMCSAALSAMPEERDTAHFKRN